jgi:hypothetical protein
VAALITQAVDIEPVLIVGDRGEFTVWVGGDLIGRKEWPDEEIVTAIERAVRR